MLGINSFVVLGIRYSWNLDVEGRSSFALTASHFSLRAQRKVTKRKGTTQNSRAGSLRCSTVRGRSGTRRFAPQTPSLLSSKSLRSSAALKWKGRSEIGD